MGEIPTWRKIAESTACFQTAPVFPVKGKSVQFYSKDSDGQWHSVNQSGDWEACSNPSVRASNESDNTPDTEYEQAIQTAARALWARRPGSQIMPWEELPLEHTESLTADAQAVIEAYLGF